MQKAAPRMEYWHPADGEAWRSFDILHLDFMANSRNVWLGLTSDGFNPLGT
jgi:uncharacterized protein YigE (DUF2233 family)